MPTISRHVVVWAGLACVTLAACGGSSAKSTTTTLGALRQPDCASAMPPGLAVKLTTDLPDSDPRASTIRCTINVAAKAMAGQPLVTGVVAASSVDELAALLKQANANLDQAKVAERVAKRETTIYIDPTNVAVNLAKIAELASEAPSEAWLISNGLAHDLYHVVQWSLLGNGTPADGAAKLATEPSWLIETAPEWFSEHLVRTNGYPDSGPLIGAQVAQRAAGFPGLAQWESRSTVLALNPPTPALPTALRYGMLAEIGQVLVDRAGERALLYDYWKARATATEPWQETFRKVFGVSTGDFYKEVDAHFAKLAASGSTTTTR